MIQPLISNHLSFSQEPILPVQYGGETFSSRVSDAINHLSLPFDWQRTPRTPRTGPRATFRKEEVSLSRRIGGRPAETGPQSGNVQIKSSLADAPEHVSDHGCPKLSANVNPVAGVETKALFRPLSFVNEFQESLH